MSVINWPVLCENDQRLDELLSHLRNEQSEELRAYYEATSSFAHRMLQQFWGDRRGSV
jgi:hypothetical protein